MQRPTLWPWGLLALLLLLAQGSAGRFLLDLLGGITLLLLLLPVLFGVAGFVGWQLLRRRLRTCQACGLTSVGTDLCPACGTPFDPVADSAADPAAGREIRAADATIDVDVVEVDDQVR